MSAQVIDGTRIARELRQEIFKASQRLKKEKGITPGLAFILVGDNPGSQSYVRGKERACKGMEFYSVTEHLPADASEVTVLHLIDSFNNDPSIHGILTQLPLPKQIDEVKIIERIYPAKDVDGFHPINIGRLLIGVDTLYPCTPAGIVELLKRSNINASGKHIVVVGRSNIVGKPVANILLQKREWCNAIVTIAHTGASDLSYYTRQADILIAAIGKPNAITASMVKNGAVVIDVGINRVTDTTTPKGYKLFGDVDYEHVKEVASAITPVPGGVGPMTIAMLMLNTLRAAGGSL
jgi:methylenetetrahydrofolate dehydrogenase (NADP+)/methenyltetrahydrofolate cyclohydrolase